MMDFKLTNSLARVKAGIANFFPGHELNDEQRLTAFSPTKCDPNMVASYVRSAISIIIIN